MELKFENDKPVLNDGKPVYVREDGTEIAFDAAQAMAKITQLNGEAKSYREAKETLESKYTAFDGIDPAKAKEALSKLQSLDDKKLIDAGEVEKVKESLAQSYQQQIEQERKARLDLETKFNQTLISNAFASSSLNDKLAIPSDLVQSYFSKHFQVKDGLPVAVDENNNVIYSQKLEKTGEPADFDEALNILIDRYPNKDKILRSSGMSGGGDKKASGGSHRPNRSTMSAQDKNEYIKQHGQQAYLALPK